MRDRSEGEGREWAQTEAPDLAQEGRVQTAWVAADVKAKSWPLLEAAEAVGPLELAAGRRAPAVQGELEAGSVPMLWASCR